MKLSRGDRAICLFMWGGLFNFFRKVFILSGQQSWFWFFFVFFQTILFLLCIASSHQHQCAWPGYHVVSSIPCQNSGSWWAIVKSLFVFGQVQPYFFISHLSTCIWCIVVSSYSTVNIKLCYHLTISLFYSILATLYYCCLTLQSTKFWHWSVWPKCQCTPSWNTLIITR